MNFKEMIMMEFKKTRRSKLIPIVSIPPLLVVLSGVSSISRYFSAESTNVWAPMFVQSALLFAYYLLPLSMLVVSVMIAGLERKNNGISRMLSLPASRMKITLAKSTLLLSYLAFEVFIFFSAFAIAGILATRAYGLSQSLPVLYLLKWSVYLFLSSIPSVALIWMITALLEKPVLSIGLNMLMIIPGVLVANTPLRIVYPHCYSGYLVSTELHILSAKAATEDNPMIFAFCATLILYISLQVTLKDFARKEI